MGQKSPNPIGLYDVHGNVWEWVEDGFNKMGYQLTDAKRNPIFDPVEDQPVKGKVLRGGCYWFRANFIRSSPIGRET